VAITAHRIGPHRVPAGPSPRRHDPVDGSRVTFTRDTALIGFAMGWIGVVVLLTRLAVALNLPPEAFSYLGP
jgi:hypothetical protein